jgi:hypothetical protein
MSTRHAREASASIREQAYTGDTCGGGASFAPLLPFFSPEMKSQPTVPLVWFVGPCTKETKQIDECIALIEEKRPDLPHLAPTEVHIQWDQCLGEGGFCTAYRAQWQGRGGSGRRESGRNLSHFAALSCRSPNQVLFLCALFSLLST